MLNWLRSMRDLLLHVFLLFFWPGKLVELARRHSSLDATTEDALKKSIDLVQSNIFRAFRISCVAAFIALGVFIILNLFIDNLHVNPEILILGRLFGYFLVLWGLLSPTYIWIQQRQPISNEFTEIVNEEWHRFVYGVGLFLLLLSYLFEFKLEPVSIYEFDFLRIFTHARGYLDFFSPYGPYIVGYLFSMGLGQFFIGKIMRELKKEIKPYLFHKGKDIGETYNWYASIVGYIDIILYVTCLLFHYAEFIGVWLAFKILGRWESSKLEEKERGKLSEEEKWSLPQKFILNNAEYNLFTIGNALSIVYAIAGWKIITWIKVNDINRALLFAAAVIIGTLIFYRWANEQTERLKNCFLLKENNP